MKKRLLPIFLAALMVLSVCPILTLSVSAEGVKMQSESDLNGDSAVDENDWYYADPESEIPTLNDQDAPNSKENPYLIFTAAQLQGLNDLYAQKNQKYYVSLEADIVIPSRFDGETEITNFLPIGTSVCHTGYEKGVKVDFNGNGHTISNIYIVNTSFQKMLKPTGAYHINNSNFGLFWGVAESNVYDLAIVDSTITATSGSAFYGSVAGYAGGKVVISNVYSNVNFNGTSRWTGGMIGSNRGETLNVELAQYTDKKILTSGGVEQTHASLVVNNCQFDGKITYTTHSTNKQAYGSGGAFVGTGKQSSVIDSLMSGITIGKGNRAKRTDGTLPAYVFFPSTASVSTGSYAVKGNIITGADSNFKNGVALDTLVPEEGDTTGLRYVKAGTTTPVYRFSEGYAMSTTAAVQGNFSDLFVDDTSKATLSAKGFDYSESGLWTEVNGKTYLKVYANYLAKQAEALTTIGAAVRYDLAGIRFAASLDKNSTLYQTYGEAVYNAEGNFRVGMLILPTVLLDGELTKENEDALDIVASDIWDETDRISFVASITELPEEIVFANGTISGLELSFTARPYVEYANGDGTFSIVYGEAIVRTPVEVADAAYASQAPEVQQALKEMYDGIPGFTH